MFVEQSKPHVWPVVANLASKDRRHSVSKTLCTLQYIIKYRQINTLLRRYDTIKSCR